MAATIVLETPRLLLRTWQPADIVPFAAFSADPAVYDFLPGPFTEDKAAGLVASQNGLYERHGTCYFAAELIATGALLGFVGLKYQDFDRPFAPCFELGWFLGRAHWGQGYAVEGALACLGRGFAHLGLDEIVSFTVQANLRSRAVMERLGMRHDPDGDFAHPALPPEHRLSQHVLYRISQDNWLA